VAERDGLANDGRELRRARTRLPQVFPVGASGPQRVGRRRAPRAAKRVDGTRMGRSFRRYPSPRQCACARGHPTDPPFTCTVPTHGNSAMRLASRCSRPRSGRANRRRRVRCYGELGGAVPKSSAVPPPSVPVQLTQRLAPQAELTKTVPKSPTRRNPAIVAAERDRVPTIGWKLRCAQTRRRPIFSAGASAPQRDGRRSAARTVDRC
jgi:hypothetical protein